MLCFSRSSHWLCPSYFHVHSSSEPSLDPAVAAAGIDAAGAGAGATIADWVVVCESLAAAAAAEADPSLGLAAVAQQTSVKVYCPWFAPHS